MTEPGQGPGRAPDRPGLSPGHWVLVGVAVLLVVLLVAAMVRGSDARAPRAQPTSPQAVSGTSPPPPACYPSVAEIGYSRHPGGSARVDFGMIVESDCPQAVVNTAVEVSAIGTDGKPIGSGTSLQPRLPVILPGQRLGVAGFLLLDRPAEVARLDTAFDEALAVPVSEFAAWAKSVMVTKIRHTGPDGRGFSTVTGTVRTDPPGARLCNPEFNLILRNKKGRIISGLMGTEGAPRFEDRFPPAADYSTAEVYVVQGRYSLGVDAGSIGLGVALTASCRGG